MYNLISEEGYFATIVIVRYWPESGKMQLALGGHLQPLWIVKDGLGDMPELNGVSLGITENANYEKKEILLSPGESILLYSDGLIEAENEKQELFGNERLIRYVEDKKDGLIGEGLLDEIRKWRGSATINDDLTILEIWRD
jgi:serine phosphatase RsbU (regulator of sigma subunit)